MSLKPPQIHQLVYLLSFHFFISCNSDEEIVYPEGGYSYLKKVAASDTNFYFLPIRNSIDRRDSMTVLFEKFMYTLFNEPNISIAPPAEDIFRFSFHGSTDDEAIMILSKDKIVIKEKKNEFTDKAPDENPLDSVEQLRYDLFDIQYRLSDTRFPAWRKRYIDSLQKVYPKLFDPTYHMKLHIKKFPAVRPFEYTKKEIKISKDKYKYFVDQINNSEFWQRPYYLKGREGAFADGYVFFLEAATKKKYHCIMSNMYFDGPSKFRKVFDELMKYANIDSALHWETYEEFSNRPAEKGEVKKLEVRELQIEELKSEPEPRKKKAK